MSAITPNLLEAIFPEGWQSPIENMFPFLPPPSPNGLIQTRYVDLGLDSSTNSLVPVDLLSTVVTTTAGQLLVSVTFSGHMSGSGRTVSLLLNVNGSQFKAASFTGPRGDHNGCMTMVQKLAVAPGPNTVTLQWFVESGTAFCNPNIEPNEEHCAMLIQEVTV